MGTGKQRRTLVISAVNFTEGGPLSILKDCLAEAVVFLGDDYEVVALVHRAALVGVAGVRYLEYPDAKSSWLRRIHLEYRGFRDLSQELDADLWLSLHDMTPKVTARRRAVYCHNPAPFHSLTARDAWLDPGFALFRFFYGIFYRINIRANDYVIVQQEWLRERFRKDFAVDKVIVAHPAIRVPPAASREPSHARSAGRTRFFYPALGRVFKNFEIIGEAARLLQARGCDNFEVLLTVDGSENRYTRFIRDKFADLASLKFLGGQSRDAVYSLYESADCLIFPSRLETWGMPISEFKPTGKPLLAADLPYAHETVGDYSSAAFFDPGSAESLARQMLAVIEGKFVPAAPGGRVPAPPFVHDWPTLFRLLLAAPAGITAGASA